MSTTQPGLESFLTYINCQGQPQRKAMRQVGERNGAHRQSITISRQAGSGGHALADALANLLQARTPRGHRPWTVFDRNLVERVLQEHHLPNRLARFMPEDRISEMADTIDELFGLHPPSWTLVRQTAETILHLAELGHVILIGRAANVITARLDNVFHVRLMGSLESRARYVQERNQVNPKEALELIQREDLGRRRYLKKYFGKDIDDPLLYHLVINTDLVPFAEAARLIVEAVAPNSTAVKEQLRAY